MADLIQAYDKLQLDMVAIFQRGRLAKAVDRYIDRARGQSAETPLEFVQANVRLYESNRPADYFRWAAWIRAERELQSARSPDVSDSSP